METNDNDKNLVMKPRPAQAQQEQQHFIVVNGKKIEIEFIR